MRKIAAVIVTVMILISMVGCQSQPFAKADISSKDISDQKHLTDSNSQSMFRKSTDYPSYSFSDYGPEKYAISPSDMIKGWNKLNAKVFLHEVTFYRDQKVLTQIDEERMIEYSINVPGTWTLTDTVFFEGAERQKAAELIPAFLYEPNQESNLRFILPEEGIEDNRSSINKVQFGNYEGYKITLEVSDYDTYYPHTYYLTDGTYVFGIVLYSYSEQRDALENILFDDIVSSFKFKL